MGDKDRPRSAELVWEDENEMPSAPVDDKGRMLKVTVPLVVGIAALVALSGSLFGADERTDVDHDLVEEPTTDSQIRRDALPVAESVPEPLLAAELYGASPSADTARSLLESIGGLEGLVLGAAEGDFDLVTFDPLDPDRLLASARSSYGPAENQNRNEQWVVSGGEVDQTLFAPDVPHDFVHFTDDGAVAFWANGGNTTAFASRAVTIDNGSELTVSSSLYASRSVVVDGTVFALTGSDDYYSNDIRFEELVADRAGTVTVLSPGQQWGWVDSPQPGVVVAYPLGGIGTTAVWDAVSLEPLDDHPLAGRNYLRIAVSGDGRVGVGVTVGRRLVVFDAVSGTVGDKFGTLDPTGILPALTLNHNGTVAITVGTGGAITLRWVGVDAPIASLEADADPPRVISERRSPRASSAVSPGALRIAVRYRAIAETRTTWLIVDTDPAAWVDRACDLAGRSLTEVEREALGLTGSDSVCD